MPPKNNQRSIILFAIAAVAIILLVGGMTGLPFDAGSAFAEQAQPENLVIPRGKLDFRFLLVLYGLLLGLSVLALFLGREGRRRALIFLAMAGVIGLAMYQFWDQLAFEPLPPTPTALLAARQTPLPTEVVPTPVSVVVEEDIPMNAPDWLVTMIGAVLAFLLAGLLGLLYLAFRQRKEQKMLSGVLAEEAEQAAAAIRDGEEIRDAILRCYAQMVSHLEKSRNLPRGRAVTPREFEHTLIRLGFPAIPTKILTGLFEAVRYGHQSASSEQTQQALESLQAIVNYAEETGGR